MDIVSIIQKMKEKEMKLIASLIDRSFKGGDVKMEVEELIKNTCDTGLLLRSKLLLILTI